MTFDPEKHKFGMAYVFPSFPETSLVYFPQQFGSSYQSLFVRSPENDLIPRTEYQELLTDAMKLVEALKEAQKTIDWLCKGALSLKQRDLDDVLREEGEEINEALAAFQSKYGERT